MRYAIYLGNTISIKTYEPFQLSRFGAQDKLRCPVCKELVTFVDATRVRSYFKHRNGNNSIECNDYHPGQSNYHPNDNYSYQKASRPGLNDFIWSGVRLDIALFAKNLDTTSIYFQVEIDSQGFNSEQHLTVIPLYAPKQNLILGKEGVRLSFVVDPSKIFLKCNDIFTLVSQQILKINSILEIHKYLVFDQANNALIVSNDIECEDVSSIFNSITGEMSRDVLIDEWKCDLISDGYTLRYQREAIAVWPENILEVDCSTNTIHVENISIVKIFNESTLYRNFKLRTYYLDKCISISSLTAEPGLTEINLNGQKLSRVVIEFKEVSYYIELSSKDLVSRIAIPTFDVGSDDTYEIIRDDNTEMEISSTNGLWQFSYVLYDGKLSREQGVLPKNRRSWNRNLLDLEWLDL